MSIAKRGTKTAVPRLRFPGFSSSWEQRAIGPHIEDCASRVSAATSLPIYTSSRTGLKPQGDYYGGQTLVNEGEYGVVPAGCFVYRHMSDDGLFVFNINDTGGDIAVSKEYPVFRVLDIDSRFLLAELNHLPGFKAFALSQKAGGTRTRLYLSKLRTWKAPIPSIGEQQKIADCLTSLDEVIAAQGRKVEAFKAHKRGLMQQLFPREGETRPRLRFPEFRDAPEWPNLLLGEAATFYNGRAYAKEELLEHGKYRVLRVGNFFTNDHWYYSDLELEDSKYCNSGDLLYAWSASFGPRMWHGGKTIYHYHIWKVVENQGVDRAFLLYRLNSETERVRAQAANGIGMFHITKRTIENWASSFPEIGEQKRIADCLSSLDTQITAETHQLAALKTHKQGLMQQLFPAPEESWQ